MAEERYTKRYRDRDVNWPFVIATVLLLIVTGAFISSYFQIRNIASEKDAEIASRDAEVKSLQAKVTSLNSQVASLQNDLNAANARLAPLQSNLTLTHSQLVTANAYIDTVQAQIANATAQAASLKKQNDALQKVINLTESKVITEQTTVHQGMNQVSSLVSFRADYAGYVVVKATISSTTGFIQVTCDNPNFPFNTNKYYTVDQSVFSIPVLPGAIEIFAGNTDKLYEPNATVGVTYYY